LELYIVIAFLARESRRAQSWMLLWFDYPYTRTRLRITREMAFYSAETPGIRRTGDLCGTLPNLRVIKMAPDWRRFWSFASTPAQRVGHEWSQAY